MHTLEIFEFVARSIGDLVLSGICDAGATSTYMYDTEIVAENDNQYKGYHITWGLSPTNAGLTGIIRGNTVASNSIEFWKAMASVPTIGDEYFVTKHSSYKDYLALIGDAGRIARAACYVPFSATMSLVPSQWVYPVPSGFSYVYGMWKVPSGSTDYSILEARQYIDRRGWRVRSNPAGTMVFDFDARFVDPDNHDTDMIQVLGYKRPYVPTSAGTANVTTDFEGLDSFICNNVAMGLCARMIDEGQAWAMKYEHFRRQQSSLYSMIRTHLHADSVKVG